MKPKLSQQDFNEVLAYEMLKEQVKEVKPHGGYSQEYLLEYFIKNNRFNPIVELNNLESILIKKYIPEVEYEEVLESNFIDRIKEVHSYLRAFHKDIYLVKVLFHIICDKFIKVVNN